MSLVVSPTESPEALILTPTSDGVYYSDQLITFEGLLSDAEDAAETLIGYWESSVDGVLEDVDVEFKMSMLKGATFAAEPEFEPGTGPTSGSICLTWTDLK